MMKTNCEIKSIKKEWKVCSKIKRTVLWLVSVPYLSSSSSSSPMASSMASFIISSFISMISLCFSNSIMIFWIWGSFSCGKGINVRSSTHEAYCLFPFKSVFWWFFFNRPVCSWWPWLWWRLSSPVPCCCWTWASVSLDWRPECWLSSWWISWRSAVCEPNPWPWSWRRPAEIKTINAHHS